MSNKTQCPNCFNVYLISDEQYHKSRGKVRCGACRHSFYAELLSLDAVLPATAKTPSTSEQQQDDQFKTQAGETDANESQPQPSDYSDWIAQHQALLSQLLERQIGDQPVEWQQEVSKEDFFDDFANPDRNNDVNEYALDEFEEVVLDQPFILDVRTPRSRVIVWLATPLLSVAIALLFTILVYQLWLRQAVPLIEDKQVTAFLEPITQSIRNRVEDYTGWRVPQRQDLTNISLISARVEPHPERVSTTLLKVSLLNNAEISQPFPWLELMLVDENGHLVARRTLSPEDYLPRAQLNKPLKPKELQRLTVELLTFPPQAQGYELKIIQPGIAGIR